MATKTGSSNSLSVSTRLTQKELAELIDCIVRPPVSIEKVLDFLQLHREFYDLQNPGFLDRAKHKIRVHGQKLVNILSKIKPVAVLFYDEDRIRSCLDSNFALCC